MLKQQSEAYEWLVPIILIITLLLYFKLVAGYPFNVLEAYETT